MKTVLTIAAKAQSNLRDFAKGISRAKVKLTDLIPRPVRAAGSRGAQAVQAISRRARDDIRFVAGFTLARAAPVTAGFVLISKAVFNSIRAGVGMLVRAISVVTGITRFMGPIGFVLGTLAGAGGVVALVKYVMIPLAKFWAGIQLLRSSFEWAQRQGDFAINAAISARRTDPGGIGAAFASTERKVAAEMRALQIVVGDRADDVMTQTIRQFSNYRTSNFGNRDILRRWSLTRQRIARFNREGTGGPMAYLRRFVDIREMLERDLQKFRPGSLEYKIQQMWIKQLGEDASTLLGSKEMGQLAMHLTREDVVRITATGEENEILGRVDDAEGRAVRFKAAVAALTGTFQSLARGIGGDIQPVMTRVLIGLRDRLVEPDAQGRVLGRSLRDLATALALKSWEVLVELTNRIDPKKMREYVDAFIEYFKDNPETMADSLTSALGKAVGFLGGQFKATEQPGLPASLQMMASIPRASSISSTRRGAGDRARGGGGRGAPGAGDIITPPGRGGSAEQAVDDMLKLEGLHESTHAKIIYDYLRGGPNAVDPRYTPWCAAFVNAAFARAGIPHMRSNVARSYTGYGARISAGNVRKGDVLVEHRGSLSGTGGHVGLATGRTSKDGRIEMISGNTSNAVRRTWYRPGQLIIQRPPEPKQKQSEVRTDKSYQLAALNAFEKETAGMKMLSEEDKRRLQRAVLAQQMAA